MIDLEDEIKELKSRLKLQELHNKKLAEELFSTRQASESFKRKYNNFYNFNPSIFFTINTHYIIQDLNLQATMLLGLDKKLLINTLFLNYVTSNSKAVFETNIKTLLEKNIKQKDEIQIIQKNGYRREMLIESTLVETNLINIFLLDISVHQQFLKRNVNLEKSFNLLNNLFFGTDDAIAAFDTKLTLKIMNEAFCEVFSKILATKIRLGMNLTNILNDFPDLKEKITNASQEALKGKRTKIVIENSNNKNELYYCYEMTIHALPTQESLSELIFLMRDISELKLQERILHKQQSAIALSCRTSAMGEMISALAHEINQPLTAISAYSRSCLYLIENKLGKTTDNSLLVPLEKIAIQSELAGEIIHNMKNFMREGNLPVEETDINQVIKDSVAILHYELLDYQLKINLTLMHNLPHIQTNKTHIMQVILNLARNSIEALQTHSIEKPQLFIETNQCEENIIIHIRDNGPGIAEKFKNKILKTYFTTKHKGTGIGLGICRTLIEEHGGKLILQQHEGQGAWFTFILPKKTNPRSHEKK